MRFCFERIAVAVLFFSFLALDVRAQSGNNKAKVLFTVNKRPVSVAEFVYLYRKNHQSKPEEFTEEKIEDYLDLFIKYKLKVEEALFRGMDTTSKFRKEYQTYREELLKPYMPDSKVIDSLVILTYERLKEEVNASHILVQLTAEASPEDTLEAYQRITALRNRAIAGEDFGMLAAKYSEEPRAEQTKGNLGFFTAMQMVFPFEQAAYLTPVGKVSEPVRTQFGYHIVKVLDRRPSRGEVEVSHIMIRTPEGAEDATARNTIFEIYDKLQKGMDWDELAREYSEDPNSKDKGGKLRPFGVGAMAAVPEFQEMAFSLRDPGDISDPVRTQFGWHILRLESRIPLPPFQELQPSLTQRVSRDERVKISREALRRRMRNEFNYKENASVTLKLLTVGDSILNGEVSMVDTFKNEVLFTMQARPHSIGDFLSFVREQHAIQPGSRDSMDDLLTAYVDRVQMRLLEDKVLNESPDYKWLLKEYYEGILLFEIMESEVWNKAMQDTTGQRDYFNKHPGKYMAAERMVGKIYTSQAKQPLEELRRMVEEGELDAQDFLARHGIREDAGAFEQKERAIFSKVSWSPGLYTTTQNGLNQLIFIEKILPPGPQTFEEARGSVISDYQTFLEDAWITELKRKFGVRVSKKAKKRAFSQLIDQKG